MHIFALALLRAAVCVAIGFTAGYFVAQVINWWIA